MIVIHQRGRVRLTAKTHRNENALVPQSVRMAAKLTSRRAMKLGVSPRMATDFGNRTKAMPLSANGHDATPHAIAASKPTESPAVYFKTECQVCGRKLRVSVQYLGTQVCCWHCGGRFTASIFELNRRASEPSVTQKADQLLVRSARANHSIYVEDCNQRAGTGD